MTTPNKKLNLDTETVSELSGDQLAKVAGGTDSEAASEILSGVASTVTSEISIIASAALSGYVTRHKNAQ